MLKNIIFFTWCLPQTLLGLIIYIIFSLCKKISKKETYKLATVIRLDAKFGVSLGKFILLGNNYKDITIKHEYGHTLQNFIFGPLYLLAVGIPSIIRNIISRFNKNIAMNYYKAYPENWADKLGKVVR